MILLWLGLALAAPDRSAPPTVAPPVPLDLPTPEAHELRPGLLVHHLRVPGLRKAYVNVSFRRGPLELDGGSNATFTALGLAWDQATRSTSAKDLAIVQDLYDIEIFSDSGLQSASVRCVAPLAQLDRGLDLLRQVLVEPRFRRKDLHTFRDRWTRWYLTEAPTRSDTIIEAAMVHAWYPKDHPYASGPDLSGWRDVTRRKVLDAHARLLAEAPVDMLVVADEDWAALEPGLVRALEGVGVAGELPEQPVFDRPAASRYLAIDLGRTEQATLSLRTAAPRFDDPDSDAMFAVDWALGGGFLSRLNRNLREEKGITYGISSEYSARMGRGHLTVHTQVAADQLTVAIQEIEKELDGLAAEGPTRTELDEAVAARIARWNNALASERTAASTYGAMLKHRRTVAHGRERIANLQTVDVPTAQAAAERWIGEDQPRLWVVVGERDRLEEPLKELGWDVQWVRSELIVLGYLPDPEGMDE